MKSILSGRSCGRHLLLLFFSTLLFMGCHRKQPATDINWILNSRVFHRYALNKVGRVDTVFMTTYHYQNALPKDSSISAIAFTYKDANPYTSTELRKVNGKFEVVGTTINEYNDLGLLASHVMRSGDKILQERRLKYDAAHRLSEELQIKKGSQDSAAIEFASMMGTYSGNGYDTTVMKFNYAPSGLTSKIDVTNVRNEPLFSIVNVFSAADPVASYRISPKGDTLETTRYSKQNKALKSEIKGKKFNSTQLTYRGRLLAAITENLETKHKNKVVYRYDRQGQLVEQDYYTAD